MELQTSYGPSEVADQGQPATDGGLLWTLDYLDIVGSQLCISVVDAFLKSLVTTAGLCYSWIGAEIAIVGMVKGFETPIKRQFCRNVTGPMIYKVAGDLPFNQVGIRARAMYGGHPGKPSDWDSLFFGLTITGATNPASPIVVTTATPHMFTTGQAAFITGVTGNTAANGKWIITVLSATTFALNGSTSNGAYTGGGIVRTDSPTTSIQVFMKIQTPALLKTGVSK